MDLQLKGKVALVLGATQGMGRAIAHELGREGCHVVVCSRGRPEGESQYNFVLKPGLADVAKEVADLGAASCEVVQGDLTHQGQAEEVTAAVKKLHGRLDVLVNTVGLCEVGETPLEDDDWWDRSYQSVLMTSVRACRSGIPLMLENGGGSIVLTSAMSMRHFLPKLAHYSAQKAALSHFTKNLAKAYGARGIRTNAILPGCIANEQIEERNRQRMAESGLTEDEDFREQNAAWGNVTWASRFGTPSDVGKVAAFLASPAAGYVNGVLMNVDGGSEYL